MLTKLFAYPLYSRVRCIGYGAGLLLLWITTNSLLAALYHRQDWGVLKTAIDRSVLEPPSLVGRVIVANVFAMVIGTLVSYLTLRGDTQEAPVQGYLQQTWWWLMWLVATVPGGIFLLVWTEARGGTMPYLSAVQMSAEMGLALIWAAFAQLVVTRVKMRKGQEKLSS